MNYDELKKDMEAVDASTSGEINAQWSEGLHWWLSIIQWENDDERAYTYVYECCDDDMCGCGEYEKYDSIDSLLSENKNIIDGFSWGRCTI